MLVSGFMSDCSGLINLSKLKLPIQIQRFSVVKRFNGSNTLSFVSPNPKSLQISGLGVGCSSVLKSTHFRCGVYSGRNNQQFRFEDEEPFWLYMLKEIIGGLKSLGMFLVEQPGQLKYIEWPSFQNTLKTATLSLILVALLIVALTSIDSVLCYLFAFLRKSA